MKMVNSTANAQKKAPGSGGTLGLPCSAIALRVFQYHYNMKDGESLPKFPAQHFGLPFFSPIIGGGPS
jgi:hypothetical protein